MRLQSYVNILLFAPLDNFFKHTDQRIVGFGDICFPVSRADRGDDVFAAQLTGEFHIAQEIL